MEATRRVGALRERTGQALIRGLHKQRGHLVGAAPLTVTPPHRYCAAAETFPPLAEATVIEHVVGLRPGRPTVRLEKATPDEPGPRILHNYGHGGAGKRSQIFS